MNENKWKRFLEEEYSIDLPSLDLKDELAPDIWVNENKLKPEIRQKLMKIAEDFLKEKKLDEFDIKDITITGSLANYNWSKYSDIDLHILIDYRDIDENVELVRDYLNAIKSVWNRLHDIKFYGYEVEIYVQDSREPHISTGVWSLMNNSWIEKPSKFKPTIDSQSVSKKATFLIKEIEKAKKFFDSDRFAQAYKFSDLLKKKIKRMRQCGLEEGGIFSVENLAFKLLRRNGYIETLFDIYNDSYDQLSSLDETERDDLLFEEKQSAAKVLIFDENDNILMLRRGDNMTWMPNRLDVPGGYVEKGESLMDGAERETMEETSLTISDLKPVESFGNVHFFKTKSYSGNINLDLNENSEYNWMSYNDIITNPDVIPDLKRIIKKEKFGNYDLKVDFK